MISLGVEYLFHYQFSKRSFSIRMEKEMLVSCHPTSFCIYSNTNFRDHSNTGIEQVIAKTYKYCNWIRVILHLIINGTLKVKIEAHGGNQQRNFKNKRWQVTLSPWAWCHYMGGTAPSCQLTVTTSNLKGFHREMHQWNEAVDAANSSGWWFVQVHIIPEDRAIGW